MQPRSSSRLVRNPSSNPTPSTNLNPKGRNRRRSKPRIEEFNLDKLSPHIVTMADQRTMAQLLQAPTEGYEDAIVVPAITAGNFELKHGLLTLFQNKQFFGHEKEDPHAHVRYFNKITSTLKFPNVSNTSIKLMLFLFSLEGAARIWPEKEPPRSIFTWDDLVSKFINQFFPPSKTTNLRNEITNFQQHFDESFSEAWDRFKYLLRACPHHGFSELHQLDTLYNALNSKDHDSLNSAAGGNFLDKMLRECLAIIESKSKVRYSRNKPVVAKVSTDTSTSSISPDVAELKDMVKALVLDNKGENQSPATVKAVEESCITCYGTHSYRNCPATDSTFIVTTFKNLYLKPPQLTTTKEIPAISSGTLPSNTIANPRSDLKAITTRSGVSYDGPQIPPSPSFLPKVVEDEPEATKDTMHPTNNGSTEDVQPLVVPTESMIPTFEPVNALINEPKLLEKLGDPSKFLIPCDFPEMDGCLALVDLGASINLMSFSVWKILSLPDLTPTCMTLELADRLISRPVTEDVYVKAGSFHFSADFIVVDFDVDPRVPLILERSFLKTKEILLMCLKEVLGFSDVIANGSPTPYYDPIVSTTSPTLTPFGNSDFLLEEVDTFLKYDPTLPEVDQSYFDSQGDILLLEAYLNKVELKDLPPHLEYAFLEGDNKLPIFIAKDLSVEEKTTLIIVLKSHKNSFQSCLSHLERMLKRCEDTILYYHAGNFVVNGMSSQQKSKFFKDAKKPLKSSRLATMDPQEFAKVMQKFDVTHRLATPYHPQTSGQVEVSNRGLKCILERAVGENRTSWSDKLDDALWAFRTASKIPTGCTPYKLAYKKACHLPVELEHKAYWALKHANFDLKIAGDHKKVQINELTELRDQPTRTLSFTRRKLRGFMTQKSRTVFSTSVIESSSLTLD
uniref:Reverse transcriptase domain-containing protein n=1 Tax=Tanacetum cinerariifolium TaxID=118510 RepID=A0A6L2J5U3_TANCI|nr:reverse transcriptase domain-containing protein [Tanacetum cinerariifolium]